MQTRNYFIVFPIVIPISNENQIPDTEQEEIEEESSQECYNEEETTDDLSESTTEWEEKEDSQYSETENRIETDEEDSEEIVDAQNDTYCFGPFLNPEQIDNFENFIDLSIDTNSFYWNNDMTF